MAKVFSVYNGASVTTAAPVAVTTGTVVKTMIQLSTSASSEARVVEWWWEGAASAAATPAVIELMFVGSGAATVILPHVIGPQGAVAGDNVSWAPRRRYWGPLLVLRRVYRSTSGRRGLEETRLLRSAISGKLDYALTRCRVEYSLGQRLVQGFLVLWHAPWDCVTGHNLRTIAVWLAGPRNQLPNALGPQ